MKIRSVRHNNRKKVFEVGTSTKKLVFPSSKAAPTPTIEDPVTDLSVDAEAGREAFTYVLHSGRTGTVHVEQVLEYNQDPTYLRESPVVSVDARNAEANRGREPAPRSARGSLVGWGHRRRNWVSTVLDQTNRPTWLKGTTSG